MSETHDAESDVPVTEHDHSGPDWRCEACKPLADVIAGRMKWPSLHWGNLHADAHASLARAIHEAGYRPTIECAACKGSGLYPNPTGVFYAPTEWLGCPDCQGAGRVLSPERGDE